MAGKLLRLFQQTTKSVHFLGNKNCCSRDHITQESSFSYGAKHPEPSLLCDQENHLLPNSLLHTVSESQTTPDAILPQLLLHLSFCLSEIAFKVIKAYLFIIENTQEQNNYVELSIIPYYLLIFNVAIRILCSFSLNSKIDVERHCEIY